jgi:hypothetical protein
MDLNSHSNDKTKKANSLISLLNAKKLDKARIKELFLGNYASVPQEHRLTFWKLLLGSQQQSISNPDIHDKKLIYLTLKGISSSFHAQFLSSDCILNTHYAYMRHVIRNVMQLKTTNENELNLYIYLLDKSHLPLNKSEAVGVILNRFTPFPSFIFLNS